MTEQQPKLYMLVGPPCSGKSTWVDQHFPTTPVISTDRYIEQYANLAGKTYSEIFDEAIKPATNKMYADLKIYIDHDMDIIWDQTNLTPRARESKLFKVPDNYEKIAVVFNVSEAEFMKRNKIRAQNGKNISIEVFRNMMSTYAAPTVSEGFNFIIHVS